MAGNLELWNSLAQPPADALKKITGGRLGGMTDINPTWRMQKLSEVFGPVGFGWKYEITRQWTEPGANDEIFCFVNINLYVKRDSQWSEPIPGHGGNMLIEKEKNGLHNNDEGFKMSFSDALGVAAKALGMGADVYRNRWDGKGFREPEPEHNPPADARAAFGGQPQNKPASTPPNKPAAATKPAATKPPEKPAAPPETWDNMTDAAPSRVHRHGDQKGWRDPRSDPSQRAIADNLIPPIAYHNKQGRTRCYSDSATRG